MGHRLTKIYTRTGDDGTTGLGDGSRIEKDSLRIEAIGAIDELNSHIGSLIAHSDLSEINELLSGIQHNLFDLGGELCIPDSETITPEHIIHLEAILDNYNEKLSPLKEFILPGGSKPAASCHLARAVCRRAERRIISLNRNEPVSENSIHYLNRLSDLLFVLARYLNSMQGKADVLWQPAHRPTKKSQD